MIYEKLLETKDETLKKIEDSHKQCTELQKLLLNNLEQQLLMSKGLLTSRGIFEQQLYKCLMEMKLLGICPIKEKFNAASVIEKIVRNKTTLPPEGPSYRLLQATEKCKGDLSILFSSLSKEIHGAPWSGPGVKVYTSLLREEDGCLLRYIAADYGLELTTDESIP